MPTVTADGLVLRTGQPDGLIVRVGNDFMRQTWAGFITNLFASNPASGYVWLKAVSIQGNNLVLVFKDHSGSDQTISFAGGTGGGGGGGTSYVFSPDFAVTGTNVAFAGTTALGTGGVIKTAIDTAIATRITQAQLDTAIANFVTQSDINASIDNLIDGAPQALNTLNELAAALNDDASAFSTLLTNINTRLQTVAVTSGGTHIQIRGDGTAGNHLRILKADLRDDIGRHGDSGTFDNTATDRLISGIALNRALATKLGSVAINPLWLEGNGTTATPLNIEAVVRRKLTKYPEPVATVIALFQVADANALAITNTNVNLTLRGTNLNNYVLSGQLPSIVHELTAPTLSNSGVLTLNWNRNAIVLDPDTDPAPRSGDGSVSLTLPRPTTAEIQASNPTPHVRFWSPLDIQQAVQQYETEQATIHRLVVYSNLDAYGPGDIVRHGGTFGPIFIWTSTGNSTAGQAPGANAFWKQISNPPSITSAERTAGTETEDRSMSPADVVSMIGTHAPQPSDGGLASVARTADLTGDGRVGTELGIARPLSAADRTLLDSGIEPAAKDDQTGAEIKALYEVEANAYTDAKDTKLGTLPSVPSWSNGVVIDIRQNQDNFITVQQLDGDGQSTSNNYNTAPPLVTQAEIDATSPSATALRSVSPAILASLQSSGGGGGSAGRTVTEIGSETVNITQNNRWTATGITIPASTEGDLEFYRESGTVGFGTGNGPDSYVLRVQASDFLALNSSVVGSLVNNAQAENSQFVFLDRSQLIHRYGRDSNNQLLYGTSSTNADAVPLKVRNIVYSGGGSGTGDGMTVTQVVAPTTIDVTAAYVLKAVANSTGWTEYDVVELLVDEGDVTGDDADEEAVNTIWFRAAALSALDPMAADDNITTASASDYLAFSVARGGQTAPRHVYVARASDNTLLITTNHTAVDARPLTVNGINFTGGGGAELPDQVSSAEITAGTETDTRMWSPADVKATVEAHDVTLPATATDDEIDAGTETGNRLVSPALIKRAAEAHGGAMKGWTTWFGREFTEVRMATPILASSYYNDTNRRSFNRPRKWESGDIYNSSEGTNALPGMSWNGAGVARGDVDAHDGESAGSDLLTGSVLTIPQGIYKFNLYMSFQGVAGNQFGMASTLYKVTSGTDDIIIADSDGYGAGGRQIGLSTNRMTINNTLPILSLDAGDYYFQWEGQSSELNHWQIVTSMLTVEAF